MKIASLASGSKGNAYCVVSGGRVLLIDCGISCRELRARADAAGVPLDALDGVVFTHSHIDHIRGIATFHKCFPSVPLFANAMTAESVAWQCGLDEADFYQFENGQSFDIGSFEVLPFSIPHDTADPVGYVVRSEGVIYFHATDVGTPLASIGLHLAEADMATLESNHDPDLLFRSGRPVSLIQRISGPRGHLSNEEASCLVAKFASPRLKALALAHLSEQCNAPHIAFETMASALRSIGRSDIELCVLDQNKPIILA